MAESAPMVEEAEKPLTEAEIEVLRKQYEREGEYVTIQTKFNYAWGLIRSKKVEEIALGITMLTEIYRDSPERRRECLYFLALGHYKLANYGDARQFNQQLLKFEPNNVQAKALDKLIEEKVSREGVIGLAIVSGVLAVGVALVVAIIRQRSSKRG
ncbi:mitochondria fission 1 protein [Zychaea mexicana]|uniref:mitochondria fission 1 protein n=1 Tax=Zychaea mexicana TaxID=64656 RepID=UPI0022FF180F|nr:mitochondria fission 1 protein [Zychaea mexicana]KAI9491421.1 mitochondria fission 1 protein [Zychaea mexicana]